MGPAGMRTLLWPVDEVAAVLGQRAAERPEGHGVMTPALRSSAACTSRTSPAPTLTVSSAFAVV
jgi:hypothetical protein